MTINNSNIANDRCKNIIYSPVSKKFIMPLKLLFSIKGNIYPSYIGHVLYNNPEWVPDTNAPYAIWKKINNNNNKNRNSLLDFK